MRQALLLADCGAESPYETKTRLALVGNALPRPQTQIEVLDEWGAVVARIDMGWQDWKVGVEFDGAHHCGRRGSGPVAGGYPFRFERRSGRSSLPE